MTKKAGFKIDTGRVRLLVECDGAENEISFNPNDVQFVNRFYSLMSELDEKQEEYQQAEAELLKDDRLDSYGMPQNMQRRLDLMLDVCAYMKGKIDDIFGVNTCQKVFGGACTLEMFAQFFEGITPYVEKARTDKVQKYARKAGSVKGNVMQ